MNFVTNWKLSGVTTSAMVTFVVLTAAPLFAVVSVQSRSDVRSGALAQQQANVRTFAGILQGAVPSLKVRKDRSGIINGIAVNDDAVFYSDELVDRIAEAT